MSDLVVSNQEIAVDAFNSHQDTIIVNDTNSNGFVDDQDIALASKPFDSYKRGSAIPFDDTTFTNLRQSFLTSTTLGASAAFTAMAITIEIPEDAKAKLAAYNYEIKDLFLYKNEKKIVNLAGNLYTQYVKFELYADNPTASSIKILITDSSGKISAYDLNLVTTEFKKL